MNFKKASILPLTLISASFLLSSCFFNKEAPPSIPPTYETVTVSDTNMQSNLWTGASSLVWNKLFSFELQNNKFVIDKDLDNFNDKYSIILKAKDLNDTSYVWFKFFSISSIEMDYKQDIERALQTKINYTKKSVDIWDCLINSEWTEKWEWWIYVKKCEDGNEYLVQQLNEPYEEKSGKKNVWYKAYPFDKDIRKFLINEYFEFKNTVDSFDLSNNNLTKNSSTDYQYDPKSINLSANGSLLLKRSKSDKQQFFTKRTMAVKDDVGIIMDIFLDKTANYDMAYEITKNLKILGAIQIQNIPGKFADFEIFNWLDAKYNKFILFRKPLVTPRNLIEFVPRFPKTIYVRTFIGKNNSEVINAENDFIKNFSYKPWYEGKRDEQNVYIYSYSGKYKKYILIIGRNEKNHKTYQGKYVYAEIDNQFLMNNIKTYLDFLWKIK